MQVAQATTTGTGTNGGFRAGRPACRLPSGNGTAGAEPGSHPRSQGSQSGKRVPGTGRTSQIPPVLVKASPAPGSLQAWTWQAGPAVYLESSKPLERIGDGLPYAH